MSEEVPRATMRQFAREQRAQSETAEALIWQAVRNRRCHGGKFQRQVVLGDFIIDFVCFEHRFVFEIDGPSHQTEGSVERDICRDAWLAAQGFRALRLPNDLVIGSAELAVAKIRAALAK